MILLVSGATATLRGLPADAPVGHLVTPATGNRIAAVAATGRPWAADNGCYNGLDEPAFWAMMRAIGAAQFQRGMSRPLWVTVPDKVGDAAETAALWRYYHGAVGSYGLPLAFVAQDGAEAGYIPWGRFDCLFLGGSTAYKESAEAAGLLSAAKRGGLRVHVGRVNSERRLRLFDDLGRAPDGYPYALDSVDGTQFSMYPDRYLPRWAERLRPSQREQRRPTPRPAPLFEQDAA